MPYKYLTEEEEFPDDLDWKAQVEVVTEPEEENPDAQVKLQNLSWESALYQDGEDFQDLVECDLSDVYHEMLDGHFPVGYRFSNCRMDEDGRVEIKGTLHPGMVTTGGDHQVDTSQVIVSAILKVKLEDPRTRGAVREFLEGQQ